MEAARKEKLEREVRELTKTNEFLRGWTERRAQLRP